MDVLRLEAQKRDYHRRLSLNRAIANNKYWVLPVDDSGCEDFMPVGRGAKTNSFCGRWVGYSVCRNTELHKGIFVEGQDYTDKLNVSHQHLWCHKSSCPVCFVRGYAVREAKHITGRLEVGVERGFGEVEHLSVSVALRDKNLPYEVQRERSMLALLDRGVFGGCMIPHVFRMNKERTCLEKGVHFHCLGFIDGGFDVCRDCVHVREDCLKCKSFKGREVRGYAKDGYLVKCLGERQTVYGTAWYQLHHSSVKVGFKRFVSVTWFGVLGCRKLKGKNVVSVPLCSVCLSEMDTKQIYVGSEHIVKDIGDPDYRKSFPMDEFDSEGRPNFRDSDVGGE